MGIPSKETTFEHSILKWAREKRFGLKMEFFPNKALDFRKDAHLDLIEKWEKGVLQPTFEEVKKLAKIYKRPLAVFFLDSPPEESSVPPDRRTIGSEDNETISPEGLLVIRKARKIQEAFAVLSEELGERLTFKYAKRSIEEDPEELAKKIRLDLSIELNKQFNSRTNEDFFEYLRTKIEKTGVITLKSGTSDSFPVGDCRAFSFTDSYPYTILINNKDREGAKNFSLMHEFAHILVREAGLCNDFKVFNNNAGKINKLEVFCNRFAANFLVPRKDFFEYYLSIR
ncbi:ImmA/IrrE family metallo-endopeptidase [Patescibacteria group bacterium]|nr:ImmA/IrrE family metallo-endopeptidase [Patescibacteria group bacterium]